METYLYQPSKRNLDLRLEDLLVGESLGGGQLVDVAEGPEGESEVQSEEKSVLHSRALMASSGSRRYSEMSHRGGRRSFELNTGSSFVSQRYVVKKSNSLSLLPYK